MGWAAPGGGCPGLPPEGTWGIICMLRWRLAPASINFQTLEGGGYPLYLMEITLAVVSRALERGLV